MANTFLDTLKTKFNNGLIKFQDAMLGMPTQGIQPESRVQYQYPTQDQADFEANWRNDKDLYNRLQASPYNQGYTDDQLNTMLMQGRNFGLKDVADRQANWGIKLPSNSDLDLEATEKGYFNVYPQKIQTGIANDPRQGGILRDIALGARENYNEGFNPERWGEKKNFATRIGEGLGTLARWGDTSWGRGLIAGGLIGALGGNPTEMAAYGLSAGVGRQQKRMADQLYRNQLEEQGIDTSNIRGMVDKDTFNSIGNMQNRALNTALKQQSTESMNRLRELKIEQQKIINSTLPEMQKAKLLKANAEAQHAEDLILAKIQAYQNSAALGFLNYGLRVNADERAERKEQRTAAKEAKEQQVLDELLGGGTGSTKTTKKDSLGIL